MAKHRENIFTPTAYEGIYFTLLGALFLTAGVVLSAIKDYDVRNYNFFSTSAKTFIDTKLDFLDSPNWTSIITFLLWTVCGILVYIAIWFVASLITAYRDDRPPLHGFLTPRGTNRQDEMYTFVARGLIRFVALIMSVVWLVVLLRTVMPYLTKVFATALSPFGYRTPPTLLVASFLLGASLYVLLVLVRFIFLRKRLLSSNVTQ